MHRDWENEITHYQTVASQVLKKSKQIGATQAAVHCNHAIGFSVNVRQQAVETFEHHQACGVTVIVYLGHQRGAASTTDLSPAALDKTVNAAYRIAKLAQEDSANGLAEHDVLAKDYPTLDLYHSWNITPDEAVAKAKQCEAQALEIDSRICHSEGVSLNTGEYMTLYSNTHGFMGHYLSSSHTIACSMVARDTEGNMQSDGSYTVSRDPYALQSIEVLAKESSEKTLHRLGASRLKTQKSPVIFEANVASSLIGYFLQAISGNLLYKQSSFLLDKRDQAVFPNYVNIQECPYELKGLGSRPFDSEGVAAQTRYLIQAGVLQGYLLGSYAARRLGLKTTGNAGGYYNIHLTTHEPHLSALLAKMDKGLLVTEVMGSGVNLVTGDYSQGVSGFWVENGQIQYPVEEITIAGNLAEMYQNIVAIAGDKNLKSKVQAGSILIERMTIAGE